MSNGRNNAEQLQEKSRYEVFQDATKADLDAYREKLMGDGTYSYISQVLELERLSNYMNENLLVYLFGDLLGPHLADKFFNHHKGNLLSFLSKLSPEYRFFILYELKTNRLLLSYC